MTIQPTSPAAALDYATEEWNALASEAIEIEGYSQYGGKENDNTLDSLVSVPFIIKTVTFRHGDIKPMGWDVERDYVSCEAVIHPQYADKFKRRYVIFNDGSTGIYRQIVAALVARGMVTVPEQLPEEGPAHETRYDISFSESRFTDGGDEIWTAPDFNVKLLCPEGLRKSSYKNPTGGGDSVTWYLA